MIERVLWGPCLILRVRNTRLESGYNILCFLFEVKPRGFRCTWRHPPVSSRNP